ncbi:xylan 1,4-beta-xylosidase [Sphingobium sp. Leaf26]|uniref:family 43 glycosylhydrolase n=1 Tax=Sphingobium sp. Leaf26 TaxID=1735693 RepID=UPI000700098C|nr:family 43 glycosylhydrolase [Sphingobium sp. Leaf26]KQN00131.1 xylan 1,4-beta-xylosidase [Sphingobium sp. Leaf26]
MTSSRRHFLTFATLSAGAALSPAMSARSTGTDAKPMPYAEGFEGQRRGDLGDGRFVNPILAGDRPDPTILKDGDDYYAAFSSFLYYPGVPIWHSRDLVNWTPVTAALKTPIGTIWALDIAKHGDRYFIYIPVLAPEGDARPLRTYVIHAPAMSGPWSEPIDMHIDDMIDPGHAVGEDGKRYLFFNGGNRVKLRDDGLAADGKVEHVYDGWPIPADYVIEGFALEGPKVLHRDGYYYLIAAQGGTAGPPTSHMVVAARSRSINGPWENCPYNPVVRTASRNEPWWSRGHATAVEGPDGRWWLTYHGYENGFRTLGRQMLLEPMEWTTDGWPRALGGALDQPFLKPVAQGGPHGQPLSGLSLDAIGNRLTFFAPRNDYLERARMEGSRLSLTAQGTSPADASPLLFVAGDRAYEIEVDVEIDAGTQAGLILFYNEKLFCGLGLGEERLHAYRIGQAERWPAGAAVSASRVRLRLVNDENVVTFYYALAGEPWRKERSVEVAGYNHNVADGFLSLRPGLYAAGTGAARFDNLVYRARRRVGDVA